ncbi:pyridoxal phosphate-dependent transferase [Aspergillus stella-maris]|uniref:pyridoxal phosphate-dependent transferase n=1 Tax=Aspergillus stella-maris TaxID=1810926 RepID=UPI003CCD0CFE
MDVDGLRPDRLEMILSSWDTSSQGPRPRVLYTIPAGQNLTGYSQTAERRAAIYAIAENYDLIIIEDDPYYFLRLGPYISDDTATTGTGEREQAWNAADPSYLSLDTSGRVVRLDSTSKILAPGLRMGWLTASAQIIDKFLAYQEVSTVAVSGPTQLMLWSLLDQTWGHDGFDAWLTHLFGEYQWRRNVLLRACERYLPAEIASWVPPRYGMFLWIKVDWRRHPAFRADGPIQGEELDSRLLALGARIADDALQLGVLVTQDSLFSRNKRSNGELHFRMTFAAASEGDLEEGVGLFGETLAAQFGSCVDQKL